MSNPGARRTIFASMAAAAILALCQVSAAAAAEPTLDFSASKTTVLVGKAAQLTWTATNVSSCVASGGWSGTKPISGSMWTGPLQSQTTYTLTCYGTTTIKKSVVVRIRVPSMTLTASPSSIRSGESATLSWNGSYVWGCKASGAWSGSRNITGSEVRSQLTTSESYTLSCSSGIGTIVAMTSVTVSTGSAQLSWQRPTENTDGSALTDLTGFRIHVGSTSRNYVQEIEVRDPAATSYSLSLAPGEYYIAMTAVDADGNESAYSNEVRKVVP